MSVSDQILHQTDVRPRRAPMARNLVGVSAGNFIEWYDFAIYAYSIPTISRLFFKEGDPSAALLSTLAIFAVAFLARPSGGVFFGRLGDRIGRRNTLVIALLLMGFCTTLMGLIPTYETIGLAAPALLAFLRLGQGFSGGGEAPGAATFLGEHAPPDRRATWVGLAAAMQVLPFAVAALVVYSLQTAMSEEQFLSWGWRIPFLLSAPLSIVALILRLRLKDSPIFTALENSGRIEATPVKRVLRDHKRELALLVGIASVSSVAFYTISGYLIVYLKAHAGLSYQNGLAATTIALCIYAVTIPCFGAIADRIGRKGVISFGAVGLILLAIPGFLTASQGGLMNVILGMLMMLIPTAAVGSVVQVAQFEIFPSAVRFTGCAIGYNIAYAAFGGTAPLVAEYLVLSTEVAMAPAYYLMAVATVALVPIMLLPETSNKSLEG